MPLAAPSTDTTTDIQNRDDRNSALVDTSVFAAALAQLARIKDPTYKRLKYRMFLARNYLQSHDIPAHQHREAIHRILEHGGSSPEIKSIPVTPHPRIFNAAIESVKSFASAVRGQGSSSPVGPVNVAKDQAEAMSDTDFIAKLPEFVREYPAFVKAAYYARQFAFTYVTGTLLDDARRVGKTIHKLSLAQARLDHDYRINALHQAEDRQRWASYKESIGTKLSETTTYAVRYLSP